MKTLFTSLVAIALLSGTAFAQSNQSSTGGCNCAGATTSTSQSSCCSKGKEGSSCACSAPSTTLVSTPANQQQEHQQQQQQAQQQQSNLTAADHLQIAVQKICPVTGEALGSMGEPIKVQVGEQIAFLCCSGCQGKELNADHWNTIQTNLASAQGTCPIMGKPVTADMESTVVNGQQIFVCCPPCIAKIQADPNTALNKVNASYVSFVQAEAQAKSDHSHMVAQGICPVSGQTLGSMGTPIKVQVGDELAFLCCQDCQGKEINAEHWATVQANLAKAQGVCPVMGEAIDATMKSTVVNGRRIFVCCPPCIEKINADPATYVAMLDAQIANGGAAVATSTDGHTHAEGHDHSAHQHDK